MGVFGTVYVVVSGYGFAGIMLIVVFATVLQSLEQLSVFLMNYAASLLKDKLKD